MAKGKQANAAIVPIASLIPDPGNTRAHPDRSKESLSKSVGAFGAARSIVVDGSGMVRAGNGTLEAARAAGIEEAIVVESDGKRLVVVKRPDWTPEQALAYAIADNRLQELSFFDPEALMGAMNAIAAPSAATGNLPMDAMGFTDNELAALLAQGKTPAIAVSAYQRSAIAVQEPATPDPPKDPITKAGDVWTLGRHTLRCGDAQDVPPVQADAMLTDPPYGVDYISRVDEERQKPWGKIENDDLRGAKLVDFLRRTLATKAQFSFVCCDWHSYSDFEKALGKPKAVIVWDKGSFGLGKGYRRQHEFLLFYGTLNRTDLSDVWAFPRDPRSEYRHPTQKPVALFAKAMDDVRAKTVWDPFLGSGTTLLAAEQLDAICHGIEKSPAYCDVVVERWQNLTGGKAKCARG